MKNFEYEVLIVGCGLSGSVLARHFAEKLNKRVLMIDRRNHIAGNMYDYTDENGFLVQKYGPHTFHTNSDEVVDYLKKYSQWESFNLECMVKMKGKFTPSPFNFQTIDDYYSKENATELKKHIKEAYGDAEKTTIVEMLQSSDKYIKEYADFLYKSDYSLYTAKQWGISPDKIDVSVLKRVPVLFSYKKGYFDDKFQAMPKKGFTAFFKELLNHDNITVQLNMVAESLLKLENDTIYINGEKANIPVVYTGAIDELLGFRYGKLPYRSLSFEYKTISEDSYQDAPIVAYPEEKNFTRITEYTKLPVQKTNGKTVIALEYPQQYSAQSNCEPYYPILTEESINTYNRYRSEAQNIENLILCGRLADFKYYNMDQALENVLQVCKKL